MRRLRRQDGFTLNEILISIALIAIGILGFSLNTMGVIQGNQISGNYTIATNLAQDKLEELKATAPSSLANGSDTVVGAGAGGGATFTRTWTVTTSSHNDASGTAASGSELKQVEVQVEWSEYRATRNVTTTTIIFKDAA